MRRSVVPLSLAVALPLHAAAAQSWRVEVTPFAAHLRPGALHDSRWGSPSRPAQVGPSDDVPLWTDVSGDARLAIDPARVHGVRVAVPIGRWRVALEGAGGPSRIVYRSHTRATNATVAAGAAGADQVSSHAIALHGDARAMLFGAGVERRLATGLSRLEGTVGVGASLQVYRAENLFQRCENTAVPMTCQMPWRDSYSVPGSSGMLALQWRVLRELSLEARGQLSRGAHRSGMTPGGAPVETGAPSVRQWVTTRQLALGLVLRP